MAQQQAYRDYLKSKGHTDEEIGYDNGTVLLKGKRFAEATPNADGRTYADTRSLDQAYGRYDVQNQQAALRQQAAQPDPELGAYRKAIQDRVNKPVQQFNYDVKNSAEYQAALSRASANSQTAGNNAMVSLGSRGIGNSSITSDRVAQIGQREVANVEDTLVPQMINQAYQRYMGQNQLENQQTGNMLGLYGTMSNENQQRFNNSYNLMNQENTMNQQDITNARNDTQDQRQKRLDNTAVQQWYQQQYGVPIEAKDDWSLVADQVKGLTPLAMQQYLQGVKAQEAGLTGMYNDAPTMQNKQFGLSERQANASIANMGADNSRANEANVLARDRFNWDKDPNNPNNIYKQASAGKQSTAQVPAKESADNYSLIVGDLGGQGVTKDQAVRLAQANRDNLSDADYRKLIDYIEKEF